MDKISATEQLKLTRAIQKAATVATVNDQLDRNQLLANQLNEQGVDKKFAKVASAAFNKRITVLTFQKTADQHRAEPFALTDDSKVFQLMGGQLQQKTASVQEAPFIIELSAEQIQSNISKTASQDTPKKPLYEDTMDYKTYLTHLQSVIEKQAAEVSYLSGVTESLDSKVKEQAQKLADYFQKSACGSYEFTTAVNVYGDKLRDVLGPYLPQTTDFNKTASAAIAPKTETFKQLDGLMKDAEALDNIQTFMQDYGIGLSEFCKSAAAMGQMMQQMECRGLTKEALSPTVPLALGNVTRGVSMLGFTGLQGVDAIRRATENAMLAGFDNARNMYNAGRSVGMHPSQVLDADFLTKDRHKDRMMSWSDMTADPQLSMYPAAQVFQAVNKLMDTDPSLERPDKREVLRAQVAQLLAQNNRQSTADVAALATTLKNLAGTGGSAAQVAAAPVGAMDKVDRPEPVELKHILETQPDRPERDYATKYLSLMQNDTAQAKRLKERAEDKAERQKMQEERRAQQIADRDEARAYSESQRDQNRAYSEAQQKQNDRRQLARQVILQDWRDQRAQADRKYQEDMAAYKQTQKKRQEAAAAQQKELAARQNEARSKALQGAKMDPDLGILVDRTGTPLSASDIRTLMVNWMDTAPARATVLPDKPAAVPEPQKPEAIPYPGADLYNV